MSLGCMLLFLCLSFFKSYFISISFLCHLNYMIDDENLIHTWDIYSNPLIKK